MSGIVLSASVRQNLLSLQSTADLLATTQNRLSTGKKVNTALDNPTNFFTAQALDARAGDINNLLDGIGNGVQVLQAANTGITSLQKLVDTAKSLANQALQSAVGYSTKSNVSATIPGATAADLRGKVVLFQFCTYTCINWLRTLPYLRAWASKYRDDGLTVIGVHTPEFDFEGDLENVVEQSRNLGVEYPVALESYRLSKPAFTSQGIPSEKEVEDFLKADAELLKLPKPVAAAKIFDFSLQREVNQELGIK